jgi:hypothetical protein
MKLSKTSIPLARELINNKQKASIIFTSGKNFI